MQHKDCPTGLLHRFKAAALDLTAEHTCLAKCKHICMVYGYLSHSLFSGKKTVTLWEKSTTEV